MPAKRLQSTVSFSGDESDTEWVAFQTQVRIQKLRKERDQEMNAVITDAEDALEEIKTRAVALHSELLRQKAKSQSKHIDDITRSLERRQAIEAQMTELLIDTHAKMKEVESLMMAGYEGRSLEASAILSTVT